MSAYIGKPDNDPVKDLKYFQLAIEKYKIGSPIVEAIASAPRKYGRIVFLAYEYCETCGLDRAEKESTSVNWPFMFRRLLSKFDVDGLAFRIQTPANVITAIRSGYVTPSDMVKKRLRNLYCLTYNINGNSVKL